MPGTAARRATSSGSSARTSGSPPVTRSLATPSSEKIRARRSISSKLRICARGRKRYASPKSSAGMQ